MEVTKEQILELMTSAYMAAHQQTVDGVAMSCRQGTLEECEDIFESEFEQSLERVSVDAVVIRMGFEEIEYFSNDCCEKCGSKKKPLFYDIVDIGEAIEEEVRCAKCILTSIQRDSEYYRKMDNWV